MKNDKSKQAKTAIEEVKEIKDVETYDASEGQSETVHYNANSKKGFPRDVNIQGGSNGISFVYEDRGAKVTTSVDDK
ncbi:MAG: hypothetical protein AB8G22_29420 [Saprospiraceae bacterium]